MRTDQNQAIKIKALKHLMDSALLTLESGENPLDIIMLATTKIQKLQSELIQQTVAENLGSSQTHDQTDFEEILRAFRRNQQTENFSELDISELLRRRNQTNNTGLNQNPQILETGSGPDRQGQQSFNLLDGLRDRNSNRSIQTHNLLTDKKEQSSDVILDEELNNTFGVKK